MEKVTLEGLERDLEGILGDCKEQGLNLEELRQLFAPLTPLLLPPANKIRVYQRVKGYLRSFFPWILFLGFLGLLGLLLTDSTVKSQIRFHGLAVIRIALIKVKIGFFFLHGRPSGGLRIFFCT